MADKKIVFYGNGTGDFIKVESLTDELKFVELMKLYKACPTIEDLQNSLTAEAKEVIRTIN